MYLYFTHPLSGLSGLSHPFPTEKKRQSIITTNGGGEAETLDYIPLLLLEESSLLLEESSLLLEESLLSLEESSFLSLSGVSSV